MTIEFPLKFSSQSIVKKRSDDDLPLGLSVLVEGAFLAGNICSLANLIKLFVETTVIVYFRFTNLICMNLVNSFSCLPGTDNTSTRSFALF